MSNFHFYR